MKKMITRPPRKSSKSFVAVRRINSSISAVSSQNIRKKSSSLRTVVVDSNSDSQISVIKTNNVLSGPSSKMLIREESLVSKCSTSCEKKSDTFDSNLENYRRQKQQEIARLEKSKVTLVDISSPLHHSFIPKKRKKSSLNETTSILQTVVEVLKAQGVKDKHGRESMRKIKEVRETVTNTKPAKSRAMSIKKSLSNADSMISIKTSKKLKKVKEIENNIIEERKASDNYFSNFSQSAYKCAPTNPITDSKRWNSEKSIASGYESLLNLNLTRIDTLVKSFDELDMIQPEFGASDQKDNSQNFEVLKTEPLKRKKLDPVSKRHQRSFSQHYEPVRSSKPIERKTKPHVRHTKSIAQLDEIRNELKCHVVEWRTIVLDSDEKSV